MEKLFKHTLFCIALLCSMGIWAVEPDGNGVYQIGSAQELKEFAALVNSGQNTIKGALTADIDLSEVIPEGSAWNPIGNWDSNIGFLGEFDGQGHTIKGLSYSTNRQYQSLFGVISTNAVVKNFTIYGDIFVNSDHNNVGGVVGFARDNNVLIQNVHSYVNVTCETNSKRLGGILGTSYNGTITIDRCTYSGTLKVSDSAGSGNYGGMVGYVQNSTSAILNVTNCVFDGTLANTLAGGCTLGGLVGYVGASPVYTIKGCLSVGTFEVENTSAYGAIFGAVKNKAKGYADNFYTEGQSQNGSASTVPLEATEATDEMLASGEVAYKLNGDQTTIAFFQTLGDDALPTLDNTHKQVYAEGTYKCDGTLDEDAGVNYTNIQGAEGNIPDHSFDGGFCSVCGQLDTDYLTADEDGFFTITTGEELAWFAAFVNQVDGTVSARLENDIDLSGIEWKPIGNLTNNFKGTFDGQGYNIEDMSLELNSLTLSQGYGLFGNAYGATIKNFKITGEINVNTTSPGDLGIGTIGWPDGGTLVQNIKSEVNITSCTGTHIGGIVGSLRTATVDRCEYAGTMDLNGAANGNGGIAGYSNNGTITNCIFSGHIQEIGTSGYYAGILAYVNSGNVKVNGCLSTGTIETDNGTQWAGAIVARLRNINTIANCYYTNFAKGAAGGEYVTNNPAKVAEGIQEATDEQLESGETTWKLNGSTYVIPAFRQTLGFDTKPTLDTESGIVYPTANGYESLTDEEDITDFMEYFVELEADVLSETPAYREYVEAYTTAVRALEAETYGEFVEAYSALKTMKANVTRSASLYQQYIDACAEVKKYMEENDVFGKEFDLLQKYLVEETDPSEEEFANGSYLYILKNCQLDDAAIKAETQNVKDRLQKAIAANYTEGTDITDLVVNANFAEGTKGWETTASLSYSSAEAPAKAASTTGTFELTQTMTDIKPGIYMVKANAMHIAGGDIYNDFYATQILAGDNVNYVMTPSEDGLTEDECIPGVNCLTDGAEGTIDEIMGLEDAELYVPVSAEGFAYAVSSDRYTSYAAVRVENGELTFGIKNPGTKVGGDKAFFGNVHVVYLGTGNTACEGLDPVLQSYAERAKTIIDFEFSSDTDLTQYPNISQALKDQLQACIDAIPAAQDGNAKMQLVDSFSALMADVYNCRMAYIAMAEAADEMTMLVDNLLEAGITSEEVQTAIYDMAQSIWDAYENGTYNTEEALAAADKLRNDAGLYPGVDEDGTMLLGNATQLMVFAQMVTSGQTKLNAKLTSDIDMEGYDWTGIGTHASSAPYLGTFDGQNHRITNLHMISTAGWSGFFSMSNGVIRNMYIDGDIDVEAKSNYIGFVGHMNGGSLQNIHCALNFNFNASGCTHAGGLVGDLRSGAQLIGCEFSGTINAGDNTDSFGGLVGYTNNLGAMRGCIFSGTITANEENAGKYFGGLTGYANTTSQVYQYCLSAGKVLPVNGSALIGSLRSAAPNTYSEIYYLEGSANSAFGSDTELTNITANTHAVTADQLASGEVASKINASTTYVYQTLGEDACPTIDSTHGTVYIVGNYTCYGESKDNNFSYSNTDSSKRDEHDFHHGACAVCGISEDGDSYIMSNALHLAIFRNAVNAGNTTLNGSLAADIDLTDYIKENGAWNPIGNWDGNIGYAGTFDGQGHTVSGFTFNVTRNYQGLFGVLVENATVRNFGIEGTITLSNSCNNLGAIGLVRDNNVHISGIKSNLNIVTTIDNKRIGGIVGTSYVGDIYIDRCEYTGTLSISDAGGSGNYGGIVGYVQNNASSYLHVTNCLFTGKVANTNANPGGCTFGGLVGYIGASPVVTIQNNLSIGEVDSKVNGMICGAIKSEATTYENNYFKGTNIDGSASTVSRFANSVNDTQLASGEVAYKLNNGETENVAWFQTIGNDAHPVLNAESKAVFFDGVETYYNLSDEEIDAIAGVGVDANISTSGTIYNLAGQRLTRMQKGLNIINGKKILIK